MQTSCWRELWTSISLARQKVPNGISIIQTREDSMSMTTLKPWIDCKLKGQGWALLRNEWFQFLTELKVIICDCHMKLAKWKAILWRNKCIFCNGDLFEKLVVCSWSKSHCYLEYKTWSIRHRPTGLCPNLRRQNYNKTRPKSVRRCSSQTYCHISMEPKIFDTKMCEYGIFVAKMGKYGIFVAQICKYGIFCREIL